MCYRVLLFNLNGFNCITFPEEIMDKIFEYEHYIVMTEYLPMFKYVLKDIEEGHKIILTDLDWH